MSSTTNVSNLANEALSVAIDVATAILGGIDSFSQVIGDLLGTYVVLKLVFGMPIIGNFLNTLLGRVGLRV